MKLHFFNLFYCLLVNSQYDDVYSIFMYSCTRVKYNSSWSHQIRSDSSSWRSMMYFPTVSAKSSGGGHWLDSYTAYTWSNVSDVLCLNISKEMQLFNVKIRPAWLKPLCVKAMKLRVRVSALPNTYLDTWGEARDTCQIVSVNLGEKELGYKQDLVQWNSRSGLGFKHYIWPVRQKSS